MTTHESFKRRVRDRMRKTGERYAAARRALLDHSVGSRRQWISSPEMAEPRLIAATGRGWDDWCDIIDAWPGHRAGHTAIAAFVRDVHGVDGWWAQTVTVGYERITGIRVPYQRADGSFSISKTKTVEVDAQMLRSVLLDADGRRYLFADHETTLRSRVNSKDVRLGLNDVRLGVDEGVLLISLESKPGGRTKVVVTHEGLNSADDADRWKFYWTTWLEAIDAHAHDG